MAKSTPNKLSTAVKVRIVTMLASFERPSVVRDTIKKEFGVDVGMTAIVYYDPETSGTQVAKKWCRLFEETRARYIKDAARVPIMQQAYRARKLQRVLDLEEERTNTVGMRETLEQAAKEQGGAFTNKRELSGANGAPVPLEMTVRFVQPTGLPSDDTT